MIPVHQRIIDPGRGDCQTAAIASILELTYEDVPTWIADAYDMGQPHKWFGAFNAWLANRNLFCLTIAYDNLNDWRNLIGVYAVASMPSQRYKNVTHAVVVTWKEIEDAPHGRKLVYAHDPNPFNEPYVDEDPIRVSFLVQINPAIKEIK